MQLLRLFPSDNFELMKIWDSRRLYKQIFYDKERTVAIVGLQGHGKTLFLASLFRDSFFVLSDALRPYSVRAVTAKADDVFYGNAIAMQALELPPANPRSKPDPAILEFSNIPRPGSRNTRNIRLTFYDIAGEVFSNDRLVSEYASFLKEADDIIFLLDPTHEEFNVLRSARLIDLVNRMNPIKQQNIIIALSKLDELREQSEWSEMLGNLWPDLPPSHFGLSNYLTQMDYLSELLRQWWREPQREAQNLINSLPDNVHFCALSAVGHPPVWDCPECQSINVATVRKCKQCEAARLGAGLRLARQAEPFRVRDPLFWVFRAAGVM
jgi:GTPase SAR1 family protein